MSLVIKYCQGPQLSAPPDVSEEFEAAKAAGSGQPSDELLGLLTIRADPAVGDSSIQSSEGVDRYSTVSERSEQFNRMAAQFESLLEHPDFSEIRFVFFKTSTTCAPSSKAPAPVNVNSVAAGRQMLREGIAAALSEEACDWAMLEHFQNDSCGFGRLPL